MEPLIMQLATLLVACCMQVYFSTLKMEATCSSGIWLKFQRTERRYRPERRRCTASGSVS
jgi:hypothetical protein